ncbi:MAG: hypothetical protein ACI9O4_000304 [Chitinophagales bacterium]|jgi:hypothetical protein
MKRFLFFALILLIGKVSAQEVSYQKTSSSAYQFTIDNNQEAINTFSYFMGYSLLLVHSPTMQLYVFDDFESKPLEQLFVARKAGIYISNGFWYKTDNGGVHVFRNDATNITEIEI